LTAKNPALSEVMGHNIFGVITALFDDVAKGKSVMEHDEDLTALPIVDDPTVKDVFAEFCTGLNFVHGNLHMTFASVTADHSVDQASSKRIVSARIVMPIIGAIELRDLLTHLIDALTEQGVITSGAPLPTIVIPPGRRH
jgi:hypothetical protein